MGGQRLRGKVGILGAAGRCSVYGEVGRPDYCLGVSAASQTLLARHSLSSWPLFPGLGRGLVVQRALMYHTLSGRSNA